MKTLLIHFIKMMLDEPNLKFKQLDKIKFPVLIVVGEYDMISFKHTKAIKNHLVNSRLVVLEKNITMIISFIAMIFMMY